MKFKLIINKDAPEQIVATVHQRSGFTDRLEALVSQHTGTDRIAAYADDEVCMLAFADIECITVIDGKTYAIDSRGKQHRLKLRLYELEAMVPSCFIRINKSSLANENRLERFIPTFSGAVDAQFKCGYREYVSRRCFATIRRRYDAL